MTGALASLTPVLLGLCLGALLRRTGVAAETDGHFLLRVAFYVAQPALVFTSLASVPTPGELWVFPAAAAAMFVVGWAVGRLVRRRLPHEPLQAPVFLTACMLINTGFALPFVQVLYGAEGIARLAAFEIGTTVLGLTWVYAIAARGNPDHQRSRVAHGSSRATRTARSSRATPLARRLRSQRSRVAHGSSRATRAARSSRATPLARRLRSLGEPVLLRRLIRTPLIYAVALGLLANAASWQPPEPLARTLEIFGAATAPILTLAIGIVFAWRRTEAHLAAGAVLTRLGAGVAVAGGAIALLGLTGVDRGVLLLLAVAPVGYSVVTFASLERLDTRFAAGTLSLSLLVSTALAIAVSALGG